MRRLVRAHVESYEHWFGAAPPADVWPRSQTRLGRAPHDQRVNTRDWRMVPRARIARTSAFAACSLAAVLSACAAAAGGSDDGLAWLLFFVLAGAVFIGWLVNVRARPPAPEGATAAVPTPVVGGATALAQATITATSVATATRGAPTVPVAAVEREEVRKGDVPNRLAKSAGGRASHRRTRRVAPRGPRSKFDVLNWIQDPRVARLDGVGLSPSARPCDSALVIRPW